MIPIECPKCGRGGNVPPDRLNARLTCKACHSVFHMDQSGKITLGEPGNPDKKANRHAEAARAKAAPVELNLSIGEMIGKIPKPVQLALVAVVLLGIILANVKLPKGVPSYNQQAAAIVESVVKDDKPAVLAGATSSTADAAGKWFDLLRVVFAKKDLKPGVRAIPSLFDGEPDKGSDIQMSVILADAVTNEQFPYTLNIFLAKDGSRWALDGAKTYDSASQAFAKIAAAKK